MMKVSTIVLLLFLVSLPYPIHAEITPSEIDESKASRREHNFSEWVTSKEFWGLVKEKELGGSRAEFPVFVEQNKDGKSRVITQRSKDPVAWHYVTHYSEAKFLSKHDEYVRTGFALLTAHVVEKERKEGKEMVYSGVWIRKDHFDTAMKYAKRYGISQAKVKD